MPYDEPKLAPGGHTFAPRPQALREAFGDLGVPDGPDAVSSLADAVKALHANIDGLGVRLRPVLRPEPRDREPVFGGNSPLGELVCHVWFAANRLEDILRSLDI